MSETWTKMYIGYHVMCPLFLFDFNESCNFSTDFRKMFKYEISRKIVQWEPSWSFGKKDRQTDMTKLTVAFRNLANAPKMITSLFISYNSKGKCLQRSNFWTHIYIIQVLILMQRLNVPFNAKIIPELLFFKYVKYVIDI